MAPRETGIGPFLAGLDGALAERIRALQDPTQGGDRAYGAPRITAELNDGTPPAARVAGAWMVWPVASGQQVW